MTRKELYNHITSLGLQNEVKAQCGKNYTMCSNVQLEKVVTGALKGLKAANKPAKKAKNEKPDKFDGRFSKLVEVLAKKKILLKSEIDAIMNA